MGIYQAFDFLVQVFLSLCFVRWFGRVSFRAIVSIIFFVVGAVVLVSSSKIWLLLCTCVKFQLFVVATNLYNLFNVGFHSSNTRFELNWVQEIKE